jgi:AAA family ATP:ADP antiporter
MARGASVTATPAERAAVRWSFGLFFCVFAGWYAIRPVRDAIGIAGNVRQLPQLFLITLGATLLVSPLLSALVSRLPRRRFITVAYRAAALSLLAFALLFRGGAPSPGVARVFFVWSSVLNLFEITLAWALMADLFSRESGIRVFAFIGGGGTLGAILGSALASAIVGASLSVALCVSALLLEGAVLCTRRISVTGCAPERPYPEGGLFAWLGSALRSGYFLAICGYLLAFTFSSTVLYLEQARILEAGLHDTAARAALLARIDLAANLLSFALQVTVVGHSLERVGIGSALALLPLVTLACFVALRCAPLLPVLVACQVGRRAIDFAFTKPAREVLFTVVQPADKYKAKSFIDTFVYRSGDAFGALGVGGLSAVALVGAMIAVCGTWAVVGVALGRASSNDGGGPARRDITPR